MSLKLPLKNCLKIDLKELLKINYKNHISYFTFSNNTIFIIVIDNDGSQRPANPTTKRRGYEVGKYGVYFYKSTLKVVG